MTKVQLHLHPYFNGKNILSKAIPYFDNYCLEDLIDSAEKKDIGVLGLERLNFEIFNDLVNKAEKLQKEKREKYKIDYSPSEIRICNNENNKETTILRATEYRTKQSFDIIVLGYSGLEDTKGTNNSHSIHHIFDSALKNNCLLIMDHPFCNARSLRKDITEEKEDELRAICNIYSGNADSTFMEWNGYCIPWLRKLLLGGDVNKKVEEFSSRFKKEYNIDFKLVSDMDGHLRYKGALNQIEKGAVDMEISKGMLAIPQIKEKVNKGEYFNNTGYKKGYVTLPHFIANMGVPYILEKYLKTMFNDSRA